MLNAQHPKRAHRIAGPQPDPHRLQHARQARIRQRRSHPRRAIAICSITPDLCRHETRQGAIRAGGVEAARELGADEIEIVNDSQLVARQLTGEYKVKHPAMKPLYEQAIKSLRAFDRWRIRSVPRAQNAHSDALVNGALDATG